MPLFKRERHQRIESVLRSLDGRVLAEHGCLFGGGTAIALQYGEYRESVDIDFKISNVAGYRELRSALTSDKGIAAIVQGGASLTLARDLRADQYGIRTTIAADGVKIKFEIVLEGRINLDAPGPGDQVCGIKTLTPLDAITTKLLANSDRWADDFACGRDLIDLAMMAPNPVLFEAARQKAASAYSLLTINRDLAKAKANLLDHPEKLVSFMAAMKMEMPLADLQRAIALIDPPSQKLARARTP